MTRRNKNTPTRRYSRLQINDAFSNDHEMILSRLPARKRDRMSHSCVKQARTFYLLCSREEK